MHKAEAAKYKAPQQWSPSARGKSARGALRIRKKQNRLSDKTIDYNPSTKITNVGKNPKFYDIFQTLAFISHF